jgi:hypothetical protein
LLTKAVMVNPLTARRGGGPYSDLSIGEHNRTSCQEH